MSRVLKSGQIVSDGIKIGIYQSDPEKERKRQDMESASSEFSDDEENKAYYALIPDDKRRVLDSTRDKAKQSSARILEEAYSQRDKIINTALEESERLREQAYQNGYLEGLEKAGADVEESLRRINSSMVVMGQDIEAYEEQMENQVLELAFAMTEKILKKSIKEDDTILADLVEKAVLSERDKNSIVVHLPDSAMDLINLLEKRLEPLIGRNGGTGTMKLRPGSYPPGTVRIETEEGIVDASLAVQIENLKRQLAALGSQP